MVIPPKTGHIDTASGFAACFVGVSVEYVTDEQSGETLALLHLDVARDAEIDNPFSVGVPLDPRDVERVIMSLSGAALRDLTRTPRGERLN
jgi:hypothetical protein